MGRWDALARCLTASLLRGLVGSQSQERLLVGTGYADQDLMFARPDGTAWPPMQFAERWRSTGERCTVEAPPLSGAQSVQATATYQRVDP